MRQPYSKFPACDRVRLPYASGFTVVELLVAMAVVALIMIAVVSFLDATQKSIGISQSSLEASERANRIFLRISADLETMIQRSDVQNLAQNKNGAPFLSLLCQSPTIASSQGQTYFGQSKAEPAVVHYCLLNDPGTLVPSRKDRPILARSSQAGYQTASMGLSTSTGASENQPPTPVTLPAPSETGGLRGIGDYDFLADGVLAVCVGFLDSNSTSFTPANASPLSDQSTLIVALALVEQAVLNRVKPSDLNAASNRLGMPTGKDAPVKQWLNTWKNGPGAVPEHLWYAIRFYQQEFDLK